ncbi:MAG TPA: arginine--tRNA ligase [Mycobacteriales bacterium]|nr:arginine--tRNA ligase [Mycobacteriales bacterium]
MTPAELSAAVLAAVRASVAAGELSLVVPDRVVVERPRNREHGDYATNVAMQLARAAAMKPREVAEIIRGRLVATPGIAAVEVAGPGFLNFTLEQAAQGELARTITQAGRAYGRSDVLAGRRLNLEFVSANPTGPLHIGAARWAAVGDALARLLAACGATVAREYYFNDAGVQVDRFAESLMAAVSGLPVPAGGYAGAYVGEVADWVVSRHPGLLDEPEEKQLEVFRREGVARMFDEIKSSLATFGVHFDVYFSEQTLHDSGELDVALDRLREQGHVYDAEGAVWLRTTDFGDDKDRVLVKSDGSPTYFCADAAYYLDKRQRGFDRVVIMLGADHHGYLGRMRAMVACFGEDPDQHLEILVGQLVSLLRGGEPVRMSKRAGDVVTLEDLVDAVGVDAARYALARSSVDSTLEIDLDLWAQQTNDNPVFYVQYAHARISSLLRNAADLGIPLDVSREVPDRAFAPALLTHERERDLLGVLGEFPRVVAGAAELREAHRVARHLEELAGTYHRFYDSCRVLPVGDEPVTDLTVTRLTLCEATRVVLANGLDLLGVRAPERM